MPFTFVEIEERKTRQLALLFVGLVLIYAVSIITLLWGLRLFIGAPGRVSAAQVVTALLIALAGAGIHWVSASYQLVDRVLSAVLARPVDSDDTYHAQFKNIVEEVAIATGGRYTMEPHVIPTPAMNACAVSDIRGRCAIVVTEGLLARLNRAQLESVIGHEAAHIASGDSLTSSMFCGLFSLHEEGLKRLSGMFSSRSAGELLRGRGGALILFLWVVLWVTTTSKRLCEMLVSREKEYRADAVAVRLTRNPLSLAEALRAISAHWRGVGAEGESLSTIFIMDPGAEYLSEREGMMATLFSTHPPTERRIAALLDMAHIRPEDFEQEMSAQPPRPRQLIEAKPAEADPARWFAWLEGAWQGPLTLEVLAALPALTPETWIRAEEAPSAKPAYQDPHVLGALQRRYQHEGSAQQPASTECPKCHIGLARMSYEGVPIDECPACRGCYVNPDQMARIFSRRDYTFSEDIQRLAKMIPAVRGRERVARTFQADLVNRVKDRQCPKCGSAVMRKFYTSAYLVEVEQCWICGLAWLDRNELELLQYLYEQSQSDERPINQRPS